MHPHNCKLKWESITFRYFFPWTEKWEVKRGGQDCFLLLWGLRCSSRLESTGCHHLGQAERPAWCKEEKRHQDHGSRWAQQIATIICIHLLTVKHNTQGCVWTQRYLLCYMRGDLKNWICEARPEDASQEWQEYQPTMKSTARSGWVRGWHEHWWH